jgi:hypothetical protein
MDLSHSRKNRDLFKLKKVPDPEVLGLPDQEPDPLVGGMDPDPVPSIIKQK